jgi:hypothetical protein
LCLLHSNFRCNFVAGAWKALFDLAGGLIQEYDREAMASVSKFVDQLPSVMNQVLYESKLFDHSNVLLQHVHLLIYF